MAVMRRPAPLRSGPALGSFYPSRTPQITTVLHSDLTVRHQFLGGDGGVTVRPRSCSTRPTASRFNSGRELLRRARSARQHVRLKADSGAVRAHLGGKGRTRRECLPRCPQCAVAGSAVVAQY
jgi:hypothetical protein